MGRPPSIPAEKKARVVLSVIAGELSVAEAARREKVSEQSIGRWKADFLEAGKTALVAGKSGPSTREEQLEAEVADLTQALGEAAVEIRVWKKSAEGRLGPSRTPGVIRVRAGMSTTRFCALIDMPERTWRRWQAKARAGGTTEGSVAAPSPHRGGRAGPLACVGASGLGAPQDLGHGPPRRPRRLPGQRAAAAA